MEISIIPPPELEPIPNFDKLMHSLMKWASLEFTEDGCWLWKGSMQQDGYSHVTVGTDGKLFNGAAHVLSFMLYWNVLKPNSHMLQVCHQSWCHERSCIAPSHLRLDTAKNNTADSIVAGTHSSVTKRRKK